MIRAGPLPPPTEVEGLDVHASAGSSSGAAERQEAGEGRRWSVTAEVSAEDSRRRQVVGKLLKALEQGTFDEKSKNFDIAWHVGTAPEVPLEEIPLLVRGFKVLKPRHTNVRNYYNRTVQNWLFTMDLRLDRDWEEACRRSWDIPEMLARSVGLSDFKTNCFGEVCIQDAVLAIGICLRLHERIPVLLVGEFDDGSDVAISLLVSKLLGLSHEVTTAEDFALNERTPSAENSRLVLARCSRNALHREEELRKVESEVFEGSNGGTLALASLHYSEVTVLDLQLRLPRSLQAAVVFR